MRAAPTLGLRAGQGRERIYIVEPTGALEDDPNLTDKRFPGNPTQSYLSRESLRVVGEVEQWEPHPPKRLAEMKAAPTSPIELGPTPNRA